MLFMEDLNSIERRIDQYSERNGCYPKVIAVKTAGVFTLGDEEDSSRITMLLFLDALKIAVYTESFGGYRFIDKEKIDFIKNWKVKASSF